MSANSLPERASFTVPEFAAAHGLCVATVYRLGRSIRIPKAAAQGVGR
jgi:hypothetical protein